MQEDIDPFEMMEAVNIVDRLAKDFFEKLVNYLLMNEWEFIWFEFV